MRRTGVMILLAGLALLLAMPPQAGARVLPPGSYRDTCNDCYVDDGWLECRCKDSRGDRRRTSIKYYRCGGDIVNQDGRLRCGGSGRDLPQGPWRDSCRNARMRGDELLAECKNRHGDWVQSWLNLRSCNRQVSNDNGRLICGRVRTQRVPGGSWRDSCRRWRVDGDRMWAECKNRRGDWHGTEVRIRGCRRLANDNGKLRCVER